eukprot:jgi/Undpi1/1951/HiC_scaffold_12.g05338.m1
MGCKKTFAILLASLLSVALVFVAPGAQQVVSDNSLGVAEKKWTTQDLVQMGKSKAMAAAVSYMTRDAQQAGAKALKLDDMLRKSWVTIVMEKGWTAIKNACTTLSVKTAAAFLVLALVVFSLYTARATYWLAQKRAGLRILEGIVSRRKKSAMAPRFEVWKEAAAALTIDPPD